VYGEKGRGGMAIPGPTPQEEVLRIGQLWSKNEAIAPTCRDLGQKWKVRPCIALPAKSATTLMDIDGPSRITHIWITSGQFRDLILRMYWDNEETPSVEVPLPDFFCCAWNTWTPILSLPINVNANHAFNSFFPMPFRKHGKITIENRTSEELPNFFYAISCADGPVDADEAYFHAQFRHTDRVQYKEDYTILDGVKGRGHYVGTHLGWQQNNQGWWGEGEVKMFIDGDGEFPSYCGTGTEDYFGSAWGFANFSAPFFGYKSLMTKDDEPLSRVGNRHTMYRFHLLDPIYFERDLRVTIQDLGWRSEGRFLPLQDAISSVAYWYQTAPHAPFPPLGSRDDLEVI
jgi:hypothetical protein